MRRAIRIVSDQNVVTNAEFSYAPEGEDAEPVDFRQYVQGVDIHLHVGEVATCDVRLICPVVDAVAEIDQVILDVIPPEQIPRVIKALERSLREYRAAKYRDGDARRLIADTEAEEAKS